MNDKCRRSVAKLTETILETGYYFRESRFLGRANDNDPRFLRWLRIGHSPGHHEHASDYRKPQPFWILRHGSVQVLDCRFWIPGMRLQKQSIHGFVLLALNPKSKPKIQIY